MFDSECLLYILNMVISEMKTQFDIECMKSKYGPMIINTNINFLKLKKNYVCFFDPLRLKGSLPPVKYILYLWLIYNMVHIDNV